MLENKKNRLKQTPENAVLVGLITSNIDRNKAEEYLDELTFLVQTAGGEVKSRFLQALPTANSKTFVGSGKLEEIREYVKAAEID